MPFSAVHHSPLARAGQTADVIAGHLPQVPQHACDFTADRTPVPSTGQRDRYPGQIGWFVRHVLDAPLWRWIGRNQANCAITIVRWDSGRPPTLVSFNDTGHL